ncbi:cation:proton antiporter [Rubellicoccus peritrichatus]|uniref:Cation:proton antiporter n=1 Tax=Rubellicoccus peritrichatus TaxID=3080537 RepID=A0AAQ3QSH3_9BACT|nr:cation:proton antiporter [Puniceicoccus sp. CR14]WOO40351.1 cation:proton antiporter [Puniceicoccus sp. CR14]
MDEATGLIVDLGVLLLCAAFVTLIFRRLRLPVFLGYVLAGFLIGPNLLSHSPIHDIHAVHSLSELGVVFLMFYIGMEFDISRLRKVLMPAVLAVILQTVVMILIGTQMAPLFGWGGVKGIFLGALLAISSSMITISVLQSLGRINRSHAHLAIGILILEDILAVTLLVLLSGVAVSGHVDWLDLWKVTFVIAVFTVAVYCLGRLFAPRILKLLESFNDPELTTICAVALMLGLGTLAVYLHLSVALGAFLAGSILSQSSLAHRIEHLTAPLRNVFCAVFFVAAGMLIEPTEIIGYWWQIILMSALVVIAKVGTVWLGLFLSGQDADTSFRASVVKAQIGEFSFIIATLAQTLGVANSELMAIAVGVSVLTTIAGITLSIRVNTIYEAIASRVPPPIRTLGEFYRNLVGEVRVGVGRIFLWRLLKRPITQIIITFFLLNAIILSVYVFNGYIKGNNGLAEYRNWIGPATWTLAAVLCLPFFSSILRNLNAIVLIVTDSVFSGTSAKQYLHGRMQNIFTTVSVAGLAVLVGGIYLSAAAEYLPSGVALAAFVILVGGASFFFWKRIIHVNSRLEYLFMDSFNQRSREEEEAREASALEEISAKYPWPVNVKEVVLPALSKACGKRISELLLREETGATLIALSRNGQVLYGPEASARLFPFDRLYLFGEERQNEAAKRFLEEKRAEGRHDTSTPTLKVEKLFLPKDSIFVDETLASANLRKTYGISVLGIQRGQHRMTSPRPDEVMMAGDMLYVIGNPDTIRDLQKNHPRQERSEPVMDDLLSAEE